MASLSLVTGPAVEPLEVATLQGDLGLNAAADVELLTKRIKSARETLEGRLKVAMLTQSWKLVLDRHEANCVIDLPRPPLQSVTSITAYLATGSTEVVSADDYRVITGAKGRVILQDTKIWPSNLAKYACLEIVFKAGYGDAAADVPEDLVNGITRLVQFFYTHRGEGTVRNTIQGGHTLEPKQLKRVVADLVHYQRWSL